MNKQGEEKSQNGKKWRVRRAKNSHQIKETVRDHTVMSSLTLFKKCPIKSSNISQNTTDDEVK